MLHVTTISRFVFIAMVFEKCEAVTTPDHAWDFRGTQLKILFSFTRDVERRSFLNILKGCTTGAILADMIGGSSLIANPYNNPTCTETGMSFDGINQHVQLTSWIIASPVCFESFFMYSAFGDWSRVFDFGSGANADNILFGNDGATARSIIAGRIQFAYI
jgi:hypothetical protein